MHVHSPKVNNKLCPLLATMAMSCPASTMATIMYKKCMGVVIALACVGGSEPAIACFSHLHEPTLCDQSCCMPLESDVSVELGEAEITVPSAESFGGQQAIPGTDDRKTHKDCLIDGQCKPPSSDRQTHWHYTITHPHSVHTDHNVCQKKSLLATCTPLPVLFT